jgi:glycine/D-amino acid oxidase-like deaminating enzyme
MKKYTESPWLEIKNPLKFNKLTKNLTTEVVIVGAGLSGMLTAYFLAKQGKKAVILEADRVGSGATSYTTAMITYVYDTALDEQIKIYGKTKTKLIWEAGRMALDKLDSLIAKEKIDCDFEFCDGFAYASDIGQCEDLKNDFKSAQELVLKTTFAENREIGLKNYGVWTIPRQAKFHPLKFLFRLTQVVKDLGVEIYEQTEAKDIKEYKDRVIVSTDKYSITASQMVTSTYKPFKNPIETLFKKGWYKSYEIQALIPKSALKPGLYWELSNPYYYLRVDEYNTRQNSLLLGGEDHREELKFNPDKIYPKLEEFLRETLPNVNYKIIRKWDGPIIEPSDGLALIGRYHPRQSIASAFSGNGMIYSVLAGLIISDGILKKPNKFSKLYDPKRIPTIKQLYVKGRDYAEEFIGGALKNIF